MTHLFSFRDIYQNGFQFPLKNFIGTNIQKHNQFQTTKMQVEQKMYQMDKHIQKRLLLQLSLSKNQELFNSCKQKYLKKIIDQKENYNPNIVGNYIQYQQEQQKARSLILRDQLREYLDKSQVICNYLNNQDKLNRSMAQKIQKGTQQKNINRNQKSILQKYDSKRKKDNIKSKSHQRKVQSNVPYLKSLSNSRQLSKNSRSNSCKLFDKSNLLHKNIRSKGLSRIKSQILQNQVRLINATSMSSYGFKLYQLSAYDQQKRLKGQMALRICKSTTNIKRKTRKNF